MTYDVAILGAGTAGLGAYRAARDAGASVVLIDPGPIGTTCARNGCMPSKLLIAAAEAAHQAENADVFGIDVPEVTVDGAAVMKRLQKMREMFVTRTIRATVRTAPELVEARGVLTGPHQITAGDQVIEAKAIVVATGSRPWIPPPYRDIGPYLLTNENVFELEDLPKSLLVVGAGAIGLELGQAMHRLGVRVTILEVNGRAANLADDNMNDVALKLLGDELDLHVRHELKEVQCVDDGVRVVFVPEGGEMRDEVFERVLVATGRRPQLGGLGLESAGVTDGVVDPLTGQVDGTHIFFAGDAAGGRLIQHEAAHEGRVAGQNAARYPDVRPSERMTRLAIVFTDPQIVVVGEPEGGDGMFSFAHQGRAEILDRTGAVKIWAGDDCRLTGAISVGPDAEHLGHLLAWAVQSSMTVHEALSMPYYHPVLEEGLRSALKDLDRRTCDVVRPLTDVAARVGA